jgi:hypothetical protein
MPRLILLLAVPLMLAGNLFAWARFAWCCAVNPQRAWRIAIGYDQLFNAAVNGSEDETVSSRAARAQAQGHRWACVLCRLLDVFEPDHCEKSRGV